jgi:copper oxidase (laccase) domain-containing protein
MPRAIAAETFPAFEHSGIRHAFLTRIPGIDVVVDRTLALKRLEAEHDDARAALGFGTQRLIVAEQTHGNQIAVIDRDSSGRVPIVDGLITNYAEICLGIYVADCCAVYFFDPRQRAIGLIHAGKKGTELQIAGRAIAALTEHFGTDPSDLLVQLSPCIRPPDYEIDFAAEIMRQCRAAGVRSVFDSGRNTAGDLQQYYSYRAERGKTGRMLALLALR